MSVISSAVRISGRSEHQRRVKTPTVLQMEVVECGAAALGIILGYYGRLVPLEELRRDCGVSRDGTKASNILKAARRYGLKTKAFKKELDALLKLRCPYIVFWNFNHFVVVEGFRKGRAYLNDPATGPRTVSLQEFDEAYTGLVLVMEPGPDFKKGGRKPSLSLSLWERLRGSVPALMYCVLVGLLLVIPVLAVPVFIQLLIDKVLIQGLDDWLVPLTVGMVLTALLRGLLSWLQLRYLRRLKIKLAIVSSSRFLWHVLRLPVSFYDQRFAGEIDTRVKLNDRVADVLSGRLATTVIDLVMIVFYALVMIQYDVVLTATGMAFAAMNFLVLRWVSRRRMDANARLLQESGKVNALSIAGLQGIETLKASALEPDFFSRWAGHYTKALDAHQEMSVTNLKLGVIPTLLSALASVLILVIGALRVIDGNLTIGMLVAFQSLMQSFLGPVNNLVSLGGLLQELEGDVNRLDDVLRNPTDPNTDEDNTRPLATVDSCRLQGHVELRNITFGYNPLGPPLIENFSFTIRPGQCLALVGVTGSGKSTLAQLVCGLYEPWEGEILFDGKPRSQFPRRVLTDSIALVEQEIPFFEGSVRDNLTLWDPAVPHLSLVQACQNVLIHDAIAALPGGYDSPLLEGAINLSGGQRQRLEIARALVQNPSVLILDEATSALDAETERIIHQNLRRLGCSCILIAHRLSTVRDCDEIIILRAGQVVQRGTHEELLRAGGLYTQLVTGGGQTLQEA